MERHLFPLVVCLSVNSWLQWSREKWVGQESAKIVVCLWVCEKNDGRRPATDATRSCNTCPSTNQKDDVRAKGATLLSSTFLIIFHFWSFTFGDPLIASPYLVRRSLASQKSTSSYVTPIRVPAVSLIRRPGCERKSYLPLFGRRGLSCCCFISWNPKSTRCLQKREVYSRRGISVR